MTAPLCSRLDDMVKRSDFTWQQGVDIVIRINYNTIGGPATNLTDFKLRMDIRNATGTLIYIVNSDDVSEPGLDLAGNFDNEVVLGEDGSIVIVIPRTATINDGPLSSQIGELLAYDIMLRSPANLQDKILQGTIVIEGSQTKWA